MKYHKITVDIPKYYLKMLGFFRLHHCVALQSLHAVTQKVKCVGLNLITDQTNDDSP